MVDAAKREQQFRLLVEACAYTVERGGDVLAHVGPIGTRTIEIDLARRRKEPLVPVGDHLHGWQVLPRRSVTSESICPAHFVVTDAHREPIPASAGWDRQRFESVAF